MRDQRQENPPVADSYMCVGQGRQRGEFTVTRNGGRCRHVARDAGTSDGEWRVAGAGNVQVGGASHQERRWRAGETQ